MTTDQSIDLVPRNKKYNNTEAHRYAMTNELIKPEWLDDNEVLWIVQGRHGRKPIIVPAGDDSEDRALYEYFKRFDKPAETAGTERSDLNG